MYRLLIVDDEPHIIEGLKRMVNWEQYGIYQIETAVNYHDAIAKAIEYTPDHFFQLKPVHWLDKVILGPGYHGLAHIFKIIISADHNIFGG